MILKGLIQSLMISYEDKIFMRVDFPATRSLL